MWEVKRPKLGVLSAVMSLQTSMDPFKTYPSVEGLVHRRRTCQADAEITASSTPGSARHLNAVGMQNAGFYGQWSGGLVLHCNACLFST